MDDACKKLGDAGLFKSVAKAVLDGSLGCKDFLYAYMLDATRNLVRPLNRWRWSPVVKKFACLLLAMPSARSSYLAARGPGARVGSIAHA
jgi:hypothetical protein